MNKRDIFEKHVLNLGWKEPYKISKLIENKIIIKETQEHYLGKSKFGGTPDLPKEIDWPEYKGNPMVFFAQINLNEVSKYDLENILPKSGMLYFFSYFEQPINEFGSEYSFLPNKNLYKVIYIDDVGKISKRDFPKKLIKKFHFKEKFIDFEIIYDLPPSIETWKVENANLSKEDLNSYYNLYETYHEEEILGTPTPMQYGVDYDWANSYYQNYDLKNQIESEKLNLVRPEFVNLLSFTMENKFDAIGISFCYFGILKKDLKNRNFENVYFVLQDT